MELSARLTDIRERRLALLMQREALQQQAQAVQIALQKTDRDVFACDGAMEVLHALMAEVKA